jgi:spore coat protein CotH
MRYIFSLFAFSFLGIVPASAQNEGDAFFGTNTIHEVYISFSQQGYWDSLTANYTADVYMKGSITIDGTAYPEVGVKFKGNSSYNNQSDKKPFKIDMNEYISGQDIDGLKKFNLNNNFKDPSFLREKLTLDFYNSHGLHAPRCAFVKVYINGTYWGLYNFIEEVDVKKFLAAHFSDNDGNMFKGDPHGDLRWLGANPASYYGEYELHTNETANDWTDLLELINKINNSGTAFQDSLETILNTNAFIKQWAALNMFSNMDSYIGSGHNYYIYHDSATGKFEWVAWDVNESFGSFRQNLSASQMETLSMFYVSNPNNKPLAQKMLANTTYKNELINTICQWVQFDFSNAALDGKIDSFANMIRTAVYADTKKFYTNQNFETSLTSNVMVQGPGGDILGLKSFITNRRNALLTELASNGCTLSVKNTAGSDVIKLYPNPATDHIIVEANGKASITLIDVTGRKVLEQTGSGKLTVDVSALSAGMYYLSVNGGTYQKITIMN